MATTLQKSRIFKVCIKRETNTSVRSIWNGRESFELAGESQEYVYDAYYDVTISEFEKSEIIKLIKEKTDVLIDICQKHPDLHFDPMSIKIDVGKEKIKLSEIESFEIQESEFTPEQIKALGGCKSEVHVVVSVGIRGQYVSGVIYWDVDHSISQLRKDTSVEEKIAMTLIEDYLVDNNLIDERYYL